MKASPLPDQSRFAFIVGAPRCGTTTLASFLRQHPAICFSAVKEPHYFAQNDLNGLDDELLRTRVNEDYLQRIFGHCTGEEAMRAEGSVPYLYTPERVARVLESA